MDYLIELIINAIVAAFRDRTPRLTSRQRQYRAHKLRS